MTLTFETVLLYKYNIYVLHWHLDVFFIISTTPTFYIDILICFFIISTTPMCEIDIEFVVHYKYNTFVWHWHLKMFFIIV